MKRLRDLITRLLGKPGSRRILAGAAWGTATLIMLISRMALCNEGGHGHEHGDPVINWWTWDQEAPPVGWFLVDFFMFVGLLVYLTKKPLRAMFEKRAETIRAAIAEAGEKHRRAKAHADEYLQKLADIDAEMRRLIDGARKDGEGIKDRIITGAGDYARRLRQDSGDAASHEARSAVDRLRRQLAADVMRAAEGILGKELSAADQTRLLEQSIGDLEKADEGAASSRRAKGRAAVGDAA